MLIDLNGRHSPLSKIHLITPLTEFEQETIRFIKDWVKGKQTFELTTSGSTGIPKKMLISRHRMELSAKATLTALNLDRHGSALVCMNTKFIGGKMMLVRALINDMNIVAQEPSSNPLSLLHSSQKFSLTAMVPLQIESILDSNQYKEQLNNFQAVLLGGAPVDRVTEQKLQNVEASVYATYGMTETVSHIALKPLNGAKRSRYFETLPNVQIGLDERRCLTISSEITNHEKIVTNDQVELIDDKRFEWLGRIDNVINTGGIKVQSEVLETTIADIFSNQSINNRFFCFGISDDKLGQRVVLIIEGKLNNESTILNIIKSKVPKFHEPKEIYSIPQFIETETKKIQRKDTVEKLISSLP